MQANGYQAAIISDDVECSNTLSSLLDSVGEVLTEYTLLATSNDWQEKISLNYQLFTIFLDQELLNIPDFCQTLQRVQPGVAIVLLDLHPSRIGEGIAATASRLTNVVGTLEWPFKYSAILNLIHQCQIFYEQKVDVIEQRKNPLLFRSLVGVSASIERVHQRIEEIADANMNMLLLGPKGCGKEVVARNIHYYSTRSKGPFVYLYCNALAQNDIEHELYGYEQDGFSSAFIVRKGKLELAHRGTLFLEDVDGLPLPVQEKLAHVLQEKSFKHMNGEKDIVADVRVIATTSCDVEQALQQGILQKDLYQQLSMYLIEVPALKDRIEDLPLLLTDLLRKLENEKFAAVTFTAEALDVLAHYDWPGNIRELANLVNRLCMLYPGQKIGIAELPKKMIRAAEDGNGQLAPSSATYANETNQLANAWPSPPTLGDQGIDLKEQLSTMEKQLIKQALIHSHGVVAHAANYLKMRRTTLVEKMKKYKMTRYIPEETNS